MKSYEGRGKREEGRKIEKRKIRNWKIQHGQSVLEYAILLFVLCSVFVAMFTYIKRAVNAKFFVVQGRVNEAVK